MIMGAHVVQPDPAQLARCVADGYRFIAYGIDAVFLMRGAERPALPGVRAGSTASGRRTEGNK